ncbi:FG-GAP-like repeat-containing protein [Aquimonas voraii]|uniref:Intein C-terminal splicing region/RHS repeat-associated core domain-containing protein n=1 Tax=Aquimonas voraii TaxID=265719 RepID=A0A1G6SPC2_9GAMM|nr:FG-GAP-like repeat-containing protein [Aquimonas voraii]SDD18750.1 intein C-terminal splicing region/RHS repeat-associated core domain-containing protein [Aquimonas voraii]
MHASVLARLGPIALATLLCVTTPAAASVSAESAAEAPPGGITGRYVVSSIGASTYSLELQVPPGTNGMEPALGLQYNSQQGDGVVGQGVSLAGLSSITRCPATLPLDGYIGSVRFDAQDRFCLDGNRLILVGEGVYGADGTRYHTESETWTEVVAKGRCGSGPCAFVAHNKDGWRLEFGTNVDSSVPVPGRDDIISWQIARTTDLNGNAVEVDYLRDPSNLENMPAAIRYTINAAEGLVAQRAVRFDYEARPNAIPKYEGGVRFLATRRLRAIRTEVQGAPVASYALAYDISASSGRSLLRSITACAGDGTCLPPTRFEWQATRNAVTSPNGGASGELIRGWCVSGTTASHDFNGDGRPDLLCTQAGNAFAQLSTGTGLRPATAQAQGRLPTPQNWCSGERAELQWADFNGDQKADLLCSTGDSRARALVSTGDGLVSPNPRPDGGLNVPKAWCEASRGCTASWLNFDGDGRADIGCDCADGSHRVLVSTGSELRSPNSSANGRVASGYCDAPAAQSFWSDFNGDGQSDLHCRDGATQSVLVSNGQQLVSPNASARGILTTSWCGGDSQIATLDFNGDSLGDLYCRDAAKGLHQIMLSGGDRLSSPNARADGTVRSGWCRDAQGAPDAGDFNADGLADIACSEPGGRQLLLLSTGSELRAPGNDASGLLRSGWCTGGSAQLVDFNGDAMADLWCSDAAAGIQYALVHEAPYPDLVNRIVDGLGGSIRVEYRPLTDDSVYAEGGPVAFPVLDVRAPIYVVQRFTQEDGQGGAYRFAYRYEGARTHLTLRRWLGFERVRRTTLADGRSTVTRYVQDYPVVAFIGESQQFAADGSLLTSASFSPAVANPYPNVYQVQRGSERSSTYTRGVADYVYEKRYEYDAFGNLALSSDFGDLATPEDDVFDCWQYDNRSGAEWRLGYPLQHKTTRTAAACRDFLAGRAPDWRPETDLRFERTGYDARMNVVARGIYDDRNAVWLSQGQGYDALGNTIALTDWAGNTTRIEIDTAFRTFTARVTSPELADGTSLVVQYAHEPGYGNQILEIDPNGNAQRWVYDSLGRLKEEWGPDPEADTGAASVRLAEHRYGRDSRGTYKEIRERDRWSAEDSGAWPFIRSYVDGLGRPTLALKSGPAGSGQVLTEQNYDALGRPWRSSYPRAEGEPAVWSARQYDAMDRLVRLEQGDGTAQTYAYLRGELEVRSALAAGTADERSVTHHRSVREALLGSMGSNGGALRYEYDPVLQTRRVVGANGDVTTLVYDSVGRVVQVEGSDTGRSEFTYADDGLLRHSQDAAGNRSQFEYDALGRISRRSSEGPSGQRSYAFTYDDPRMANGRGQLTRVAGPGAIEQYSYTRYGQTAGEWLSIDGRDFLQTSRYGPDGQTRQIVYPDGAILDIERDAQGNPQILRLRETADSSPQLIAEFPQYSPLNQPLAGRYGNGVAMAWTYYPYAESLGRPREVQVNAADGSLLQRTRLSWNAAGQVSARRVEGSNGAAVAATYGYDGMGWLRRVESGGEVLEFDYDIAGNITLKDGVRFRYRSDSNQIESGSDGLAVEHDANGNVARLVGAGSDWRYGYNSENAMQQVAKDAVPVMQAEYDSNGRRLKRTDADGTVSLYVSADYDVVLREGREVHTRYVHGPMGRVAALSTDRSDPKQAALVQWQSRIQTLSMVAPGALAAHTAAVLALLPDGVALLPGRLLTPALLLAALWLLAALASALILLQQRLPGESRRERATRALTPWVLAVFLFTQNPAPTWAALAPGQGLPVAGLRYFSPDHLGSTTVVTDALGRESSLVAYQPYGAVDEAASRGPDDFRPKLSGKERDHDSGLYYFDARYQHPGLGRFLQPDPASQFSSPYAYVGNDPLSLTDPDGEEAFLIVVAVMAIVGATIGAYSGGAAINHTMNPAHWDWSAGKTYAGIFAGAAIGAVGGAAGPVAAEAGVAVGIVGEVLIGAGENAAFAALGGGSPKDIVESALLGGLTGGLSAGLGAGFGRVATRGGRFAARGETALAEEASVAARSARRSAGGLVDGEATAIENRALQSADASASTKRALSPSELEDAGLGGEVVCFSFVAGTPIATEHGRAAIETIAPGSRVYGRLGDAPAAAFPVTEVFRRSVDALTDVSTPGGVLRTTPEHPFWVEQRGWVAAEDLAPGDPLLSRDGERVPVLGVEPVAQGAEVFNFEVEQAHNYFAGDDEVLVHNPHSCSRRLKAMGRTPSKSSATGRQVEASMKAKGLIKTIGKSKFVKVVVQRGGKRVWKPLDRNIHMGHIVDAVAYWNKTGYKYGARSAQVRKFMLDASNYEFEWGPLNSSNGAMLGQTYRAPLGHVGPWP